MSKPSEEAKITDDSSSPSNNDGLLVYGFKFASQEDVNDSLKKSSRKTEKWTLTDRLKSIADMSPIPL